MVLIGVMEQVWQGHVTTLLFTSCLQLPTAIETGFISFSWMKKSAHAQATINRKPLAAYLSITPWSRGWNYRVTIIFLANAKRTTETAFSVCAVLHSTVNSFSRILRWQSNINTVLSKLNPRKQKLPTHLLTSKGMMLGRLKGKLVNNYLKNKQISTAFFSETGCSSEPV